jgi:hypothetical protein
MEYEEKDNGKSQCMSLDILPMLSKLTVMTGQRENG